MLTSQRKQLILEKLEAEGRGPVNCAQPLFLGV